MLRRCSLVRFLHCDFTDLATKTFLQIHEVEAATAEYYEHHLQSCTNLSQARLLHQEILRSGILEINIFVGNLIINTYRRCGSPDDARATFNNLKLKNIITWNSMLATLADHNKFWDLIHIFSQMLLEGAVPSVVTFITVLKACAGVADLRSGNRVDGLATELGFHTDVVLANVLVNLYGKCGDMDQARSIFAGIRSKTTASWTSMAAASSDNGDLGEALRLLRLMLLDGLRHNCPSLLTALHSCCSLPEAEEIHGQARESGLLVLGSDVSVANAVVKAYGKLGAVDSAREVFETMVTRNLSSWNTMLASFAQNHCSEEAMEIFSQMLLDGVLPDESSFAGGVLSCDGSRRALVRACLEESGLAAEVVVSNALISSYSRTGELEGALEIFQRQAESSTDRSNLVSWNSIISACVQNDCPDTAVLLFRKMQLAGFAADKFTVTSLLNACSSASLGSQILDWIHTEAKLDRQRDSLLATAVVTMLSKCGSPARAREVLDAAITKNSVHSLILWNEIIRCYLENDAREEAIQVFRVMLLEAAVSPNSITLARVLTACERDSSREMIESLIAESGWRSDAQVSNALVSMLARNGFVEQAVEMVLSRERNNVVAWTAAISGLSDSGLPGEAIEFFPVVRLEGVKPDGLAIAAMLNACAGAGDLAEGKKIHRQALESGLEMDPMVASSLVGMYARCGSLVAAYKTLRSIEREGRTGRDRALLVSWNNFMVGCVQHGRYAMAAAMFHRMLLQGISPNKVSFVTVIAASCVESAAPLRRIIHEACLESGLLGQDVIVQSSLVDMYGKLGDLSAARQIFRRIERKSLVSWNCLIAATARRGGGEEEAAVFLREMQQDGCRPSAATIASLVSCAREASRACGWIRSMQVEHGLVPGLDHLRGLVEMLGRAGKMEEAEEIIERSSKALRGTLQMSLLACCRDGGGER